jgi:catechol 2,3-dioxygenase-like lactoylglutathione lyase family enzyme
MLKNGRVATRLPARNLERAKAFYAAKLGLEPVEEREGGLRYVCAAGEFALFESAGSASGDHTQMGWEVDDIEATVRDLRARGVVFEEYDFPASRRSTESRTSWATTPARAAASAAHGSETVRATCSGSVSRFERRRVEQTMPRTRLNAVLSANGLR